MNYLLQVLLWVFPWSVRRKLLIWLYDYEIAPTAHIGKSIITAKKLVMKDFASIGSFCMCKKIDLLQIGEHSSMGELYLYKWISHRTKRQHLFQPCGQQAMCADTWQSYRCDEPSLFRLHCRNHNRGFLTNSRCGFNDNDP